MKIKHDAQGPRTVHECNDCKPRHTPTPWKYHLGRGENPRFHIQTEGGYQIASTTELSKHSQALEENAMREANAAFIVKAVNCHEELVVRLRTLIASLESIDSNIDHHPDAFGGSTHSIARMIHNDVAIAKEAIAKAEPKS